MSEPLRVIKLGGSLLDEPAVADRFRRWLAVQPPAANIVVVGGGAIVDAIRRLDGIHSLSPEASHWLAIRAMSVTAALAARLLDDSTVVSSLEQVRPSISAGLQILDVEQLMRDDALTADPLPASWEVTSDSIAARVATTIGACELLLLKSAPPPASTTLEALARSARVDAHFPRAARGLAIRYVDLRHPEFSAIADGTRV
jgi:aspartokinase-like uncharacterized kinase